MKNPFSLEGKSILVTGASSGIGKQIAITSASFGASVTIVARDKKKLEETLSEMEGSNHRMVAADLTKKANFEQIIDQKPFDGVVFNAGVVEYLPIKFINEEKIKNIFETNFNSTVLLSQFILKNKSISKLGSLVYISSISSRLGIAGTSLYATSKAAICAFSKVMASEVAAQGIRSNSICPGIVITAMTEQAKTVTSDEKMDEGSKAYPLGYGSTTDVAGVAIFLLSNASRWITGTDIILDGGLTLS